MRRVCVRLTALLLALCCMCMPAAAQEPVYASTQAFVSLLRQAGIAFEYQGVEANGEECISIPQGEGNMYCFFTGDGADVCFVAWYLIEYAQADELAVMRACNRLNMASDGPRFFADGSDCTVTAMLDVALPRNAAGNVAWQGYGRMADMLATAAQELQPLSKAAPTPTASVTPARTPAPSAAPTRTPAPTASAAAQWPDRVVVTSETARVRSGPGVTSAYLFTARRGDEFQVIGVSGNWYIITGNGRTGFLSMTVSAPAP